MAESQCGRSLGHRSPGKISLSNTLPELVEEQDQLLVGVTHHNPVTLGCNSQCCTLTNTNSKAPHSASSVSDEDPKEQALGVPREQTSQMRWFTARGLNKGGAIQKKVCWRKNM